MKPLFVCYEEGGEFYANRDENAPVRFYSDRTVQDEFIRSINPKTGEKIKRKRMSRKEFSHARKFAKEHGLYDNRH